MMMNGIFNRARIAALACLLAIAACSPAAKTEDQRFQELMDRIWAWNMEQFPEWATSLGKKQGLDRWTDDSPEAIEQRKAQTRAFLGELEKIDTGKLGPKFQLDFRLLLDGFREEVEGQAFPGELLALDQLGGVHQGISETMQIVPTERPRDYEAILARLRAVPKLVDQNIALLERGLQLKVTPPRVTLQKVPAQLDALIAQDSIENPILAPFREKSPLLKPEQLETYRAEALRVFHESVLPSLRKFRTFVNGRYLPEARETLGMGSLPNGKAWYAFNVRSSTTTTLSPGEIHDIGLREVARIRREMEEVMHRAGFQGDLKAFGAKLRSDPRSYYQSAEELLAGYRDICKRADAELPAFFGKLPRLTYGVKAVPDYAAGSKPAAYYDSGSIEAGRAGYFYANTSRLGERPKWQMEALALHEAVPGHHLQIALAQELEEKHELLRQRFYTAYVEGWGLYSERLGMEMGFYKDPRSEFGRLNYEMWRAVRLVTDTGLHSMDWTRGQAIDFFKENTSMTTPEIEVEVDRYLVWPAQALAYKIGELKILELRRRAEAALGEDFNLRAFHDTVLAEGALPLEVLAERVDAWILQQQKEAKSIR